MAALIWAARSSAPSPSGSTRTATWALTVAASPAAASSLAISLDMADRSSRPGSSASIRSATSSALASSTASRSGRAMDSAWLTTISPPSYDRSIGQYGSGARSSTHHSRFRSSTSSRSLTPKSAAVSASPTTFLLTTYGTRASSRCSRSVDVTALMLCLPLASCQDSLEAGDDGFAQVGRVEDHHVGAEPGGVVGEGAHVGEAGRDQVPARRTGLVGAHRDRVLAQADAGTGPHPEKRGVLAGGRRIPVPDQLAHVSAVRYGHAARWSAELHRPGDPAEPEDPGVIAEAIPARHVPAAVPVHHA